MFRLCPPREEGRIAFRRLPCRISIRPARLRTGGSARAKTLRGGHLFLLLALRRALDETRAGMPGFDAPSVRSRESDRRPTVWNLHVRLSQLDPSLRW